VRYWMKWHFKTDQGVECVMNDEAATLPSHGAQQDLIESIDNGNYPSWTVKVQIMSEEAAKKFPVNPFDLTKVWPHSLVPMQEIGKLELNRNVENYFAETEQAAFSPSNFVPGIGQSPDKMLQARLLAYQDAHRYRLGVNHNQISVNAPKCPFHNYQRDGAMASGQDGRQNFYPNDQADLPAPDQAVAPPPLALEDAWVKPHSQDDEDYYSQAGDLYQIMTEGEKDRLAATIAGGLSQATQAAQQRVLAFLLKADDDYAARVSKAL
jgi:catalase